MKRIFISYSHQDEEWKNLLVKHLKVLKGDLAVWDDRRIQAGDEWYEEIKKAINNADAAILLISADFLTSDFILREEVPDLFRLREKEKMKIFPLIVDQCAWTEIEWLNPIQARPTDGKPLAGRKKHTINKILTDFAIEIKKILKEQPPPDVTAPDVGVKLKPEKISLSKLPTTGSLLLGREKELETLDNAWNDKHTHILTLVAWGGVGKTALVNQWLNQMERKKFRGAEQVYAWSFYSQGTSEDRQVSADDFINDALIWFGDPDPTQGSPWDKGKRLADLVRKKKTLLILDGLEPLQYPPGEMQGELKDQSLKALLKELCRSQPGLCVVTTRVKVEDMEHAVNSTVNRMCLDDLSLETGAKLLEHLGVKGTVKELEDTAREFKGHALALNLLGRYLAVVHDGEIRKKDLVPRLTEEEKEGGHARRVMESYEKFLSGKPELNILYILGLFDRPAEMGAIDALRVEPAIEGLTDNLQNLSDAKWKFALKHLRDLNLLAGKEENRPDVLDCHPLVREHFGGKLQKTNSEAWKEAHSRLYEYYKKVPDKELPATLKEMEPLFTAVTHGCLASLHQAALLDVYQKRILRENEHFSWRKLGSFGSDLSALAGFFTSPWKLLVTGISEDDKGFILSLVGFILRALGRLREAAQPMEAALEARIKQEDWINAARNATNLSELYLTLGEVTQAVAAARKSVELVDRSDQVFWKAVFRTTLADALHQAGRGTEMAEAETLFREAEEMQKKDQPEFPYLYSLQGFRFCDLLLGQGQYAEVQKRAQEAIKISKRNKWLMTAAINTLALGRAHFLQALEQGKRDFKKALDELNRAVDGLREAGAQEFIILGLLARAAVFRSSKDFKRAWDDLEETREIAERGNMNRFMADYHLEAARVCVEERNGHWSLVNGHWEKTRKHFEMAKQMINKMGYHRRDKELQELEKKIRNSKSRDLKFETNRKDK